MRAKKILLSAGILVFSFKVMAGTLKEQFTIQNAAIEAAGVISDTATRAQQLEGFKQLMTSKLLPAFTQATFASVQIPLADLSQPEDDAEIAARAARNGVVQVRQFILTKNHGICELFISSQLLLVQATHASLRCIKDGKQTASTLIKGADRSLLNLLN